MVTFRNGRTSTPTPLWRLIHARDGSQSVAMVGDAFAKPMLAALRAMQSPTRAGPTTSSSLKQIISSGVMFSTEVKRRACSSSADVDDPRRDGLDRGQHGIDRTPSREGEGAPGETAKFERQPDHQGVQRATTRRSTPGSEEIGMIANGGFAPVGYYKDAGEERPPRSG